jgi:hypothetical protein
MELVGEDPTYGALKKEKRTSSYFSRPEIEMEK